MKLRYQNYDIRIMNLNYNCYNVLCTLHTFRDQRIQQVSPNSVYFWNRHLDTHKDCDLRQPVRAAYKIVSRPIASRIHLYDIETTEILLCSSAAALLKSHITTLSAVDSNSHCESMHYCLILRASSVANVGRLNHSSQYPLFFLSSSGNSSPFHSTLKPAISAHLSYTSLRN